MSADVLQDPLIAAVIGKLPAPGATWPKADRVAWLRMFAMAADVAYSPAPGIVVSDVEDRPRLQFAPGGKHVVVAPEILGGLVASHVPDAPRYVVDGDGFAMRDGLPADPGDFPPGARVVDERIGPEQGDVASIYWKTGGALQQGASLPNHFTLEAA